RLPYINSRYILPFLSIVYFYFFRDDVSNKLATLSSLNFNEILRVIFYVLLLILNIIGIVKQTSLIPMLGMACCLYLMIEIPEESWYIFMYWMAAGLIIYFSYGYRKSHLNKVKSLS